MSLDWKSMERVVAKILGDWWGCKFQRTPSSGAWSKNAQRGSVAEDFHGDIVAPPAAKFPFSVECKSYESIGLYKSLYGTPELFKWWEQCKGDARRAKKLPMLVVRENRKQQYLVGVNLRTYTLLGEAIGTSALSTMHLSWVKDNIRTHLVFLSLKDFVTVVPKAKLLDCFWVQPRQRGRNKVENYLTTLL